MQYVPYNTMQYNTLQYNTYHTIQYNAMQYSFREDLTTIHPEIPMPPDLQIVCICFFLKSLKLCFYSWYHESTFEFHSFSFFVFCFFFLLHVAISDSVQCLPYLGFVPGPTRSVPLVVIWSLQSPLVPWVKA